MIKIGIDKEHIKFIERNFNVLIKWLTEALEFYFKPNLFFRKLIKLNDIDIFKRLLFYFILLESLIFCLAIVIKENLKFSVVYVLGSMVFDIVLAIPFIIILFLTFKITKVSNPLKTATIFFLCTKIFLGFFPTFFFLVFIGFEIYLFAILRAVFVYGIPIFIFFGSSIIFSKNLKQAILIFSLSVSLFIFGVFSHGLLIDATQISSASLEKFSPLYAPISEEFLKYISKFDSLRGFEYRKPWKKIINYLKTANKYDFVAYDRIREDCREEYNQIFLEISKTIRELNEADLRFETNKEIFSLLISFLEEIDKLEKEYSKIFLYLPISSDFYKKMNNLSNQLIITQDAHIEFLRASTNYYSLIGKLLSWGIIF